MLYCPDYSHSPFQGFLGAHRPRPLRQPDRALPVVDLRRSSSFKLPECQGDSTVKMPKPKPSIVKVTAVRPLTSAQQMRSPWGSRVSDVSYCKKSSPFQTGFCTKAGMPLMKTCDKYVPDTASQRGSP